MTARPPARTASRARRRPTREAFSTRLVRFESGGVDCAGRLFRPDRPSEPPVVVMGPGLAAERSFGLDPFAERLAARGYAAFAFDYRGFGDSGGEPRGAVSVGRQLADWEAAIDRARRLDGVDGSRLAAWGISLSGGHALRLAAENPRVDAAVAVTPVTDGRAVLGGRDRRDLLRAGLLGVRDAVGARLGSGRRVKVASRPDEGGVLNHPGAMESYLRLVPRSSRWDNRVPARVFLSLWRYRPLEEVEAVRTPALLLAGARDRIVPPETVAAAAERFQAGTFVRLPTGHFGPYEDRFESAVGHQVAFLDGELRD